MEPWHIDGLALILFLTLALGYQGFYAYVTHRNPAWSARVRMQRHRVDWVDAVVRRGERIMAVQALRNIIMTNTFLASTMLLVIAFLAQFVLGPENRTQFHPSGSEWFYGDVALEYKGVTLLLIYTFAFVMFLTSLRTLGQLTLLVGNEPDQIRTTEQRDPVLFLARKLNRVELMGTYGRRAVYFSLPVFAWFYSPWLFALMSVAVWVFFVLLTDFVRPSSREERAASGSSGVGVPGPK